MGRKCRPILSCVFLFALANAQAPTKPLSLVRIQSAFQTAYDQKRFVDAAALGLYAIRLGDRFPDSLYNTACSLSLAGDHDRAFEVLEMAQKAGFGDITLVRTDADLAPLRGDARWAPLISRFEKVEVARSKRLSNPDKAAFVTSDIPRFWAAYDKAMKLAPSQRADVFQREYLDKASDGMKDWIRVRQVTAESLTRFVNRSPKFFGSIRETTLKIAPQRPATLAAFRKFKSLYAPAQFPGATFCIGAFYGGGTLSNRNLLMSAEMYAAGKNVPTDELGSWQKLVLTPTEDLPFIIAHEMIHFQQRYAGDRTLLRACIQEGSADFLGELCSGSVGQFHQVSVFPWGNAHEREQWERFQKDMLRKDRENVWLYSGSGEGVRPDDLGYFMGYKICEAYYKNATDKKQAIADMLNITDFPAFLAKSKYAAKFE